MGEVIVHTALINIWQISLRTSALIDSGTRKEFSFKKFKIF